MKTLTLRLSPELLARWQRALAASNQKGVEVLGDLVESWVEAEEKRLLSAKKEERRVDQDVAAAVTSFFTKSS